MKLDKLIYFHSKNKISVRNFLLSQKNDEINFESFIGLKKRFPIILRYYNNQIRFSQVGKVKLDENKYNIIFFDEETKEWFDSTECLSYSDESVYYLIEELANQ